MFENFGIKLLAAAFIATSCTADELIGAGYKNWAGNVQYAATREIKPQLESDVA